MNKLAPSDVKEIYTSTNSQKNLSNKYGVSICMISKILNGHIHKQYTAKLKKPNRKHYMMEGYLSNEEVKDIYMSNGSVKSLAEKYNVNTVTIYRIQHDINYTDVTKDLDRDHEKYKRIDRLDIIDIYLDERSVKEISKEYGIKPENISNIKNKKTYRNITRELDLE